MIYFLIVFLAPLIPALVIGLGMGAKMHADTIGLMFGIKFHARGALAGYVILVVVALLVFQSVVPKIVTYELAFDLRGSTQAKEDFITHLNGFQATLKFGNSTDRGIIFRQFSVDSSHTKITSSLSVSPLAGSGAVRIGIFPESTDSILLAVAPANLELGSHMEVVLEITAIERDTDPLSTSNVKFSRNDWVLAFQYAVATVSGVEPEVVDEIRQLFIFRNESQQQLSVIRVPSYQLDGDVLEFEMSARAIPSSLVESGLVEHRGRYPTVRNNDSTQLLSRLEAVIDYYKPAGTEIGYFASKDGKLASDSARSERLKVTGNSTLWAVETAVGVQPGDAVAVILRIKSRGTASAGKADHFGIRMPYPTRIFYVAVQNRMAALQIDSTAAAVDVTERNGAKGRPGEGSLNKTTADSTIFADTLLDRDSKIQLRWVWERAASAK
jgi:hypothetical protein